MKETKERQILLAFFDILGTSQLLNNGKFHKVYSYYSDMIKLCSDYYTPIIVCNPLYKKRDLFNNLSEAMSDMADFDTPYHLVNHELSHAFFSDTFLVWLYISPLSKPLLGGFLKKCSIIFCEALKRGIPLRGTISMGSAIMDEENRIFFGKPLVEAAKAELRQKWLGVAIGKSVVEKIGQFNPKDMEYLLPYRNHMKYECDSFLSDFVLDWFSYWNKFENNDIEKIIEDMNTDISFDDYYKNTLLYVKHAKKHCIIWNEHLICADIAQLKRLYKMRTNLDEERKSFMCEGIKLLTSNKILKNIEHIIKENEGVWFDPNDKDILLMYNNGFIEVGDTKISLDYLKTLYG